MRWLSAARRFGLLALAALALFAAVSSAGSQPVARRADSADRMIFWLGCDRVARLSDAELDEWRGRGVDGFVCMAGHLRGMGGTQDFTGDPKTKLRQKRYALQRRLRNSDIVGRARARG